ncbi:MAG: tellurium resistance protein [Rhodobacteraceae bacterium]|nr:tellurium resistance protein [Paracoccaceae bacterium]
MNRQPLWRSTPPAIFPVILGLVGLSLAWRGLGQSFGLTAGFGDILLGVTTVLLAFFALSYVAKLIARPGVLMEDLKSPPGRAGLSAISMSFIVFAAGLLPYGELARYVWWFGILLHVVIVTFVVKSISKAPPEGRSVTPFQLLPFVGLITAPLAGVALGYTLISQVLTYLSLVVLVVILVKLAAKFIRTRPPEPLRPSYAIILAPMGLFGMAFGQFGPEILFTVFYILAWVVALVLLVFAKWLTASGFSPVWGGLTFPVAVFTNINIMAISKGFGLVATTGAIAGGLIATALIFFIAYKALKMWAKRDLAKKTGSAVA